MNASRHLPLILPRGEPARLFWIRKVTGLDQNRRNVGRLEHHEIRKLHFPALEPNLSVELADDAPSHVEALTHRVGHREIQQHFHQQIVLINQAHVFHTADEIGAVLLLRKP